MDIKNQHIKVNLDDTINIKSEESENTYFTPVFLVKKISFDKKKRKLIISKYKQDKSYEVPAKDIVLDEIKLEGKKVDKLEIQFSHVDFWSFLIKKIHLITFNTIRIL